MSSLAGEQSVLFFIFYEQRAKQDCNFPHKQADITRTSAEINQCVFSMQQRSSGSGRKTNICQRLSACRALARYFIHNLISCSYWHAYLGKQKRFKDIQLTSGRREAHPDVPGSVSLFFRGAPWYALSHSLMTFPGTFWERVPQWGSCSVISDCLCFRIWLLLAICHLLLWKCPKLG